MAGSSLKFIVYKRPKSQDNGWNDQSGCLAWELIVNKSLPNTIKQNVEASGVNNTSAPPAKAIAAIIRSFPHYRPIAYIHLFRNNAASLSDSFLYPSFRYLLSFFLLIFIFMLFGI